MSVTSLTPEDAALLYAEAPGTQLQIGALCFFEAAPLRDHRGRLREEELRDHVSARLAALPRFRQRIAPVCADVGAPLWVDDPDFRVGRHHKRVELTAHDGTGALRAFVDRLLGEPLDPAHPLWDMHIVEGIDPVTTRDGREVEAVAVILRAHHVMADGIALHAAASLLLDTEPRPPRTRHHDWSPEPAPGPLALTALALAERSRRRTCYAAGAVRALLDPRHWGANARVAARAVGATAGGLSRSAPPLSFTAPIGPRRAFAWDSLPMADVVAIKQRCGATVNDVVLAIVAGALRRQLAIDTTRDVPGRDPVALVPVGSPQLPTAELRNRFSITSVALPVAVDDPLERVRTIHARMHARAPSPAQSLVPHAFAIADFVPPPVLRALVPRLLAHQPLVNLAVSNIPGSRAPLYLWEARMLGLHPFINVVGNVALIIGVLSYVDELGIGITVDPDVVGDPAAIVPDLRAAAAELVALAR